jgi:predicted GNAT family acetyltransferase
MIDPASLEIRHEEADERGAFYVEVDGQRLAEQVYRRLDAQRIVIVHTEVDVKLRGLGVARKLLDTLVAWARTTGTRVSATCVYAQRVFAEDPSIRDVLDT